MCMWLCCVACLPPHYLLTLCIPSSSSLAVRSAAHVELTENPLSRTARSVSVFCGPVEINSFHILRHARRSRGCGSCDIQEWRQAFKGFEREWSL